MNLTLTAEADALGKQARAFFQDHLPDDIRALSAEEAPILPIEAQKRWHRILAKHGWGGHGLPHEVGGTGWSDQEYYAFLREMALADAPRPMLYGLRMLAPTIVEYGTDDQKRRLIPPIMSGEVMWCQAFSEPNAGSDLAALKCRAILEGDRYVINGTKIWTTEAHWADALFGIFRTDSTGRKQHGITFLMMPADAPGITIRPLRLLEGTHEVNQIFFENVSVPVADRLGADGEGWTVAKFLLASERLESAEVGRSWALLGRIKRLLGRSDPETRALIGNPAILLRLAELEIRLLSIDGTERRLVKEGEAALRAAAPLLKLLGVPLQQDLSEFLMDLTGLASQVIAPEHDLGFTTPFGPSEARYSARAFYRNRVTTIYGGSTETLKNIVAKVDLGMDEK